MADLTQLKAKFEAALESTEQFPIDFDAAWRWVGYKRKDIAKEALKSGSFIDGVDFSGSNRKTSPKGGRPSEKITMTLDCFKMFCMMAGTEKGREVRLYFLKVEAEYKRLHATTGGNPSAYISELQSQVAELQQDLDKVKAEVKEIKKLPAKAKPKKKNPHKFDSVQEKIRVAKALKKLLRQNEIVTIPLACKVTGVKSHDKIKEAYAYMKQNYDRL